MSEHLQNLARQLTADLGLTEAPVQVSYLDAPPAGVAQHPEGAPSVCTYFAEGRTKSFYAALPAHEACEVGGFVLGVKPEGEFGSRLMATVGMMQKAGYLAVGEEGKIPRNAQPPKFVAYGPLGSLPVPPTNVLLFAKPSSAMLAMEAAGGPVPVNGRPMCAVVPTLNNGAGVAISIGCVGSRIFTHMSDDQMIVGIRGDHLDAFAHRLRTIVAANAAVGAEDHHRKSAYHPK